MRLELSKKRERELFEQADANIVEIKNERVDSRVTVSLVATVTIQ